MHGLEKSRSPDRDCHLLRPLVIDASQAPLQSSDHKMRGTPQSCEAPELSFPRLRIHYTIPLCAGFTLALFLSFYPLGRRHSWSKTSHRGKVYKRSTPGIENFLSAIRLSANGVSKSMPAYYRASDFGTLRQVIRGVHTGTRSTLTPQGFVSGIASGSYDVHFFRLRVRCLSVISRGKTRPGRRNETGGLCDTGKTSSVDQSVALSTSNR